MKATDATNPFNSYWYGDPGEIPEEQMPAFVCDSNGPEIDQDATSTDLITEDVTIKVIMNKKSFLDSFDEYTVPWKKQLELIVQGVDPTNNYYDPNSIVGILRHNFTLGGYLVENKMKIKYGQMPRNGSGANDDDWTGEAHITFTAAHRQTRLGST